MVAQSYKRQSVLDEAEYKYRLREQEATQAEVGRLRQQIANQREEITQLHNQWDKALHSVTWKVGRGITSRIERIPLSKGLLSAAQRVQSTGLNGFVSHGIESARVRIDNQLPGRLARLAPQLMQRISEAPKVFVLLPSVEWHLTLFQRPQHLARALAQLGNLVIYDETDLGPRRPRTAEDPPEFEEIEPNLFLFRGDPQLLSEIPKPILWAFTYNYHLKDAFGPTATVIYDWIDDLAVFPHDQKFLHDAHARAMSEADVVMSVARALDVQAKQQRRDALYLPNGVEYERFAATDLPLPDDDAFNALVAQGKPIAGYYGALASWFDYELLKAVADARPNWNFVLIGVRFDGSLSATDMLERKNIHYLGPKPYPTLPRYLQRFDVAMIPFLINEITLATSPLKLYEYFAGGRATVTTPMPECRAYEEVLIAKDAREFVSQLDLALERSRDPAFRAQVQALARHNTWQARAQQALDAIHKLPERTPHQRLTETTPRSRLSQVIGSLTQASLQSMAAALNLVAGERPRALVTQLEPADRHAPQ
jgi:glycosyltransferase involved in cell wall biosynthesis